MSRRVIPLALLATVLSLSARAEEAAPGRPLSLGQALQAASRTSPTLDLASIDVAVADAAVLEASGIEDWLLGAKGDLLFSRQATGEFGGTSAIDQFSLSASLSRLLPSGANVSLGVSGDRTRTVRVGVTQDAMGNPVQEKFGITQYTSSVSLSLSQPLLRGRGKTTTLAQETRARLDRDAAELAEEADARQVIRDVIQAYWQLALARRTLEIRQNSLKLAQEQLRRTQAGIKIGSVAPTEAWAVEQVIATREEGIVSAELAVTERSIDLRRLIGMPIGPSEVDLRTTQPLEVKPHEIEMEDTMSQALASSPELAQLRVRGEGATLEVEVTDNGLLPKLDLSAQGGPRGTALSASESLDNLARASDWFVGATLSYQQAIQNRSALGSYRRAREQVRRIRVNQEDVKQQISAAVVRAVRSARAAEKRMEISRKVIELAEKNIEAEEGRFELGRSTNFDVLQRQTELEEAHLKLAQASVDYLEALATIDDLTGELLPRYGISLHDED